MKFLAKIIIIVAVFLAGFYFGQQYTATPDLSDNESSIVAQNDEQINVNLMLDFGNGEIKIFNNVEVNDNITAFELLEKITSENSIEFGYKDYGGEMGAMVESINDIASDFENNQWWQYWVNNQYSQVGASDYQLADGDVVEWKYIKGQLNN